MLNGGFIGRKFRYGEHPGFFDLEDAADPIPVEIEWCESRVNPSDLSTYTFSDVDIGDPHPYRDIIVGIFYTGSQTEPDSLTIGGVAATRLVGQTSDNDLFHSHIYSARVPSGTTADVVVSFSGTMSRLGAGIAKVLYAFNPRTAQDTGTSIASPSVLSLDAPAKSVVFAVSGVSDNASWSWTGLTEQNDQTIESGNTFSCAIGAFAEAESVTISATMSSTDSIRRSGCSVAIR